MDILLVTANTEGHGLLNIDCSYRLTMGWVYIAFGHEIPNQIQFIDN